MNIVLLLVVKILYMAVITFGLPDSYELWDFCKDINWYYLPIELVFFALASGIIYKECNTNNPYGLFSILTFIIAYIPANSCLSMSNYDFNYYLVLNIYFMVVFAVSRLLAVKYYNATRISSIHLNLEENVNRVGIPGNARLTKYFRYGEKYRVMLIRSFMVLLCITIMLYVYSYNGIDIKVLFTSMYETRAEYSEYLADRTGSLISYLAMIIFGVATWGIPIYLFYSVVNNKIFDSCLSVLTYFCMYMMEMQKSTLMIIPVILMLTIWKKLKSKRTITDIMIKSSVVLFIVSLFEIVICQDSIICNLIIRRMFYMPTYLSKIFYDYFSGNGSLWLTHDVFLLSNVLSKMFGSADTTSAIKTISESAFSGYIISPNTGFFAEAYLQFGYCGVIIHPVILGYLTYVLRKTSAWYTPGAELCVMMRWSLVVLNNQVLTSARLVGIIGFVMITIAIKTLKSIDRGGAY